MLSVQRSSQHSGKCTPNLLPCRIDHNGPVNAADRYWRPEEQNDGKQIAHFRGRKLLGRKLPLPDGYRGAVLSNTNRVLPQADTGRENGASEEGEDQRIEVRVMEEVGEFDEVVVWGHEVAPDEIEDAYSKGIGEWISFAESIHATPKPDDSSSASGQNLHR
ncbi:ribonuclease h1 h2 small subunit [Diplodia corticola]|uniref:Ribonuclease h1 h2 small subunit n=1 Tax=Diplodia corticola TaxID=236234 RepID=A0A1J9RIX6_9PEZI|nr:ribonuclease h1 h2 small subunit [Diplodia corticola]OJD40608.1 ribonuclease h1 h2 small subunit [Diplodia corticola]